MIKRPYLLLILPGLFLAGFAKGQAREDTTVKPDIPVSGPSGYMGINGGLQFPTGAYKMKGYFEGPTAASKFATGPYVSRGTAISLSVGKPIGYSNFGVAFIAGYYQNSFNGVAYVNDMVREKIGSFSDAKASSFKIMTAMAGVFYTLPEQKLSLDVRLTGGVAHVQTPAITYSGTNIVVNNGPVTGDWSLGPNNITTAAFDLGVQLRYLLTRRLCLMFSPDVFFTSSARIAYGGNAQPYIFSNSVVVSFFSFTGGIGYRL